MAELVPRDDIPDDEDALFAYVADLLEQGRRVAAAQANAALTMNYWLVGRAISVNLLRQQRADYGKRIYATLSRKLTAMFGRGFEAGSLRRMVQFAEAFPDHQIVATVSRELSWSHLRELLPLRSDQTKPASSTSSRPPRSISGSATFARRSPERLGSDARSPTARSLRAQPSPATPSPIQ